MHDINEIKGIPSYTYPSCLKTKNKQTKKTKTNKQRKKQRLIHSLTTATNKLVKLHMIQYKYSTEYEDYGTEMQWGKKKS